MRDKVVKVKLTEGEHSQIKNAAAVARVPVAVFVRNAALGIDLKPAPPAVPAMNLKSYEDLARVGGNLNQIARHLNEGHIMAAPETQVAMANVLETLYDSVQQLRLELVGARR